MLNRFDAVLEESQWALYEVRRLIRRGRDDKRGLPARSIRIVDNGTRTDMAAQLACQPGAPTVGDDGIVRHILRERQSDGVDYLFVATPAGVEAKQRSGFEQWWQEATATDCSSHRPAAWPVDYRPHPEAGRIWRPTA